ncbi:MAG: response regulator [Oscillospiraceae bacterium]|nr:response regulator [Oscillospiraceae bacterium]
MTVLIVEPQEDFRLKLTAEFQKQYRVFSSGDGNEAMVLLRQHKPDILVLSLFLPGMDGLYFLEEAGDACPPVILCTTANAPDYVLLAAQELGVGYVIRIPCPVQAVLRRVRDMLRLQSSPAPENPETITAGHLAKLGYARHKGGFQMLKIGVPLFAQDPNQYLSDELYHHIGKLCGGKSAGAVETAIRTATKEAWETGPRDIWLEYFPGHRAYPSNKELLTRLAELLPDR